MKKAIAVIGEGITEKYYVESLKGISPFEIKPRTLNKKASSLPRLEDEIKNAVTEGYDEVYCLIDMDGKNENPTKQHYQNLKNKYHDTIKGKKNQGIQCKIKFLETERCTELWFLFHFLKQTTTKQFKSYKELEKELQKHLPRYEKTGKYFKSLVKGLHAELNKGNGSGKQAIKNAKSSVKSRHQDRRDYTYSEIYFLMEALAID